MQLRARRKGPLEVNPPSTSYPEAPGDREMTARMQFYVVHNAGEQLRLSHGRWAGKRPDRMVGR
jgi:hypothetical protein